MSFRQTTNVVFAERAAALSCQGNDVLAVTAVIYTSVSAKPGAETIRRSRAEKSISSPPLTASAFASATAAASRVSAVVLPYHSTFNRGLIQSGGITGLLSVRGGGSGERSSASH